MPGRDERTSGSQGGAPALLPRAPGDRATVGELGRVQRRRPGPLPRGSAPPRRGAAPRLPVAGRPSDRRQDMTTKAQADPFSTFLGSVGRQPATYAATAVLANGARFQFSASYDRALEWLGNLN